MSKLKRLSIDELNRLSKKYQIWCFGCGKRFYELLARYENESFLNKITAVIDNDINLLGKVVVINNRTLYIQNKKVLNLIDQEKTVIIISSDSAEKIYKCIVNILGERVSVYLYPKFYRQSTSMWLKFFSKFLDKKRLLFYAGNEPHDNADAIVDCINANDEFRDFKIVYYGLSNKLVTTILPEDVYKKSSYFRFLRFCYYYSTAKYIFYENETLEKVNRQQLLFFLNHGTIPLKRVNDVLKQSNSIDYAVCPSNGCTWFYEKQYGIPREKLLYMMPARSSKLFDNKQIIPWKNKNEKLIVWLPTFRKLVGSNRRDTKDTGAFDIIEDESAWEMLDSLLVNLKVRLLIKAHPRDSQTLGIKGTYLNIQMITDVDIEEYGISLNAVLSKADALLTDYSGIAFEYMLLNRPIGYIIHDMEFYHRGFSVSNPEKYMPGEKIMNYDQLCNFFKTFEKADSVYKKYREDIVNDLFGDTYMNDGAKALLQYICRKENENGK